MMSQIKVRDFRGQKYYPKRVKDSLFFIL